MVWVDKVVRCWGCCRYRSSRILTGHLCRLRPGMIRQKAEEGTGAGGARRKARVRYLETRKGRAFGGRMLGLRRREVESKEGREEDEEEEGWW